MKIITFTEARNKLKNVLDRVVDDADYTVITRRDADDAVDDQYLTIISCRFHY